MSESKPPVPKLKAGGMHRPTRMKITDINQHLTCFLCRGYLVDATTIIECLHSYCRACIVKFFEQDKRCPLCATKVHKTKPFLNIRPDKTLQNLVYKVVPNLFKNEMKRRTSFYSDNSQASTSKSTQPTESTTSSKMETNAEKHSFIIFTDDEQISLSLEYYLPTTRKPTEQGESSSNSSGSTSNSTADNQTNKRANGDTNASEELVDKRYLRCPAAVSISHIKKFIRHKFSLPASYQIEIMHKDGGDAALRDEYTLIDVAYIYHWKRSCQLPLLYRVYEPPNKRPKLATPVHANVPTKSHPASSNGHAKASPPTSKEEKHDVNTTSAGSDTNTQPTSNSKQMSKDNQSEQTVPMEVS